MNTIENEESATQYTYIEKLKLKDDIEKKLEQKELTEILKILVENNIKLSQNYTGVLFDLKYIPTHVLDKIKKYITFCSVNRQNQLENDNLKMEYKKELKPETYKYTNTINKKTPPLSNLYQKYKNIEETGESFEIPTCKIKKKSTSTYSKINKQNKVLNELDNNEKNHNNNEDADEDADEDEDDEDEDDEDEDEDEDDEDEEDEDEDEDDEDEEDEDEDED
jgi:hypothetical protein